MVPGTSTGMQDDHSIGIQWAVAAMSTLLDQGCEVVTYPDNGFCVKGPECSYAFAKSRDGTGMVWMP